VKYFILFVLQDINLLDEILNAWKINGARGVTVLHSQGMSHISRNAALREDLPILPGVEDLLEHDTEYNHTLFTIVSDETAADKIIQATQKITGSLDQPNTGIIAAWPIPKVVGLNPECGES
jgi:nitrogen regulatory protein P-II 1